MIRGESKTIRIENRPPSAERILIVGERLRQLLRDPMRGRLQ